jgi:hypothetical protein
VLLAASATVGAVEAVAQSNLSVRPTRVIADVPAGRTARAVLTVTNHHQARAEPIILSLVDLVQRPGGSLRIVREGDRDALAPDRLAASSRDWIELPAERIDIPPDTTREIPVLLRVPADARGTFVSGILIQTEVPEIPEGDGERRAVIRMQYGFLVPLITGIEGRPVRQDVRIEGLSLSLEEGGEADGEPAGDPTTRATVTVTNAGNSFPSLDGDIQVAARVAGDWRTVTRAALPDQSILPGTTLELEADIGRPLPSGDYRLVGSLSVDGRLMPRFEEIVAFEGDPAVDALSFDSLLTVSPVEVSLEAVPGATRTGVMEVENPGEEPVDITITVETPESLKNVAHGDIRGESYSAAPWSMVRPDRLTLRPGQRRRVRVISSAPREGPERANYYADIRVASAVAD